MKIRNLLAALVLLAASSLACSLTSSEQAATDTPAAAEPAAAETQAPASQQDVTAPTGADGTLLFLNPQDVSEVQNFRLKTSYQLTDQDGNVLETFEISVAHVSDPMAEQYIISGDMGDGEGMQTIEYIRADGQVWMQFGGSWISAPDDGTMVTLADFTPDMAGLDEASWENLGTETVNGVATVHYRSTASESADPLLLWLNQDMTGEEGEVAIGTVQMDIYVTSSGLVVRETINATGQRTNADGTTTPVSMVVTYDVMDINANDIVITPPSEAEAGSSVIPVPETAAVVFSSPGFAMYNVPDTSVEEMLTWMQEQGEMEVSSPLGSAGTGYTMTVVYQDVTYSVTLSPADNGGVDITVMGGE